MSTTPRASTSATIDDIVIGKRDGHAEYAIMSFGGFLGIGEKYHPLPWESLTYDTARGGLCGQRLARAARGRADLRRRRRAGLETTPTMAAASAATTVTR